MHSITNWIKHGTLDEQPLIFFDKSIGGCSLNSFVGFQELSRIKILEKGTQSVDQSVSKVKYKIWWIILSEE